MEILLLKEYSLKSVERRLDTEVLAHKRRRPTLKAAPHKFQLLSSWRGKPKI